MPELPEVETLVAAIRPHVLGREVCGCRALTTRLRVPLPEELPQEWPKARITRVDRRGKFLLFRGETGQVLVIHLGMTGWLRVCSRRSHPLPHERWQLLFRDGSSLRFTDPRKFGQIFFSTTSPAGGEVIGLPALGIEPLSSGFSSLWLYQASRQVRRPLKPWLLDQSVIAGIGNIYASEALFLARLDPQRPAGSMIKTESSALCRAIRAVLRRSIAAGSTCAASSPTPGEETTHFAIKLAVYEREGHPCARCHSANIQRLTQAGRSTYWCPRCQSKQASLAGTA